MVLSASREGRPCSIIIPDFPRIPTTGHRRFGDGVSLPVMNTANGRTVEVATSDLRSNPALPEVFTMRFGAEAKARFWSEADAGFQVDPAAQFDYPDVHGWPMANARRMTSCSPSSGVRTKRAPAGISLCTAHRRKPCRSVERLRRTERRGLRNGPATRLYFHRVAFPTGRPFHDRRFRDVRDGLLGQILQSLARGVWRTPCWNFQHR